MNRLDDAIAEQLRQRFGSDFSTSAALREQHAHNTTWHENQPPDGVVAAKTVQDVCDLVRICHDNDLPLICFGAGSSVEGQINAPFGGVSLDLSGMDQILAVSAENGTCTVEPGITRLRLNEELRRHGMFFPVDPGADASIGGMAATRASGTNAVRYGTMRDNVLALKAVMADGALVNAGRGVRKSATGFDLAHLLVGSEGLLGIITEVTLRIYPLPEAMIAGRVDFPDVASACTAAIQGLQYGLPFARIELMDKVQIRASNSYSGMNLPERPHLFVELAGDPDAIAAQAEVFAAVVDECGGENLDWESRAEARNELWKARHNSYWAGTAVRPGTRAITTDVCVPLDKLATIVDRSRKELDHRNIFGMIVGHVGDGNFHVQMMVDFENAAEVESAFSFVEWLADAAISLGGTVSGEHGIGQGKIKFMEREHGLAAIEVMAAIKKVLDPKGILNPGKLLPVQSL